MGEGPALPKVGMPIPKGLGRTCTLLGLPIPRKYPEGSCSWGLLLGGQVPRAKLPFALFPQYYAECHGVIYVIDSTDEERLSESKRAFGGCSSARAGGAEGLSRFRLHIPRVQSLARTRSQGPWPWGSVSSLWGGQLERGSLGQADGGYCHLFTHSREDGHE